MENNIGIYKISFLNSDRYYIGQSINIKNRIKYHKSNLKSDKHYNKKLQRTYNKYGVNSMSFEILENCTQQELNKLELFYINKYNSYHNGLNCSIGGDYILKTSTKLIHQYCAKSGKLIMSEYGYANFARILNINDSNIRQIIKGKMKTCKGFYFSLELKTPKEVLLLIKHKSTTEEYKLHFSKIMSGKGNGMYGKKQSTESKNKSSIKQKEKFKNGYTAHNKFLNEIEIINMYKNGLTQKEISINLNCSQPAISFILIKNNIKKFTRIKESALYFTS